MKIRILELHNKNVDTYDSYENISYYLPASEWAEVTDEEYNLLSQYLPSKKYLIISEFNYENLPSTIQECKELADKEKKLREQAAIKQKELAKKAEAKSLMQKEKKSRKEQEAILEAAKNLGWKVEPPK